MRRAVLVGVLSAVLGAGALAPPAQAAAAKVAPVIKVNGLSGSPISGLTLTYQVEVANGLTGQKVWLERKVGTRWRAVQKSVLPTSKQVSVTTKVLRLGKNKYRVHVFAKGNRRAGFQNHFWAARPRVNPRPPYVGEAFVLSGRLPRNGARPVRLQRWNGSKFVTVAAGRTDRAGYVEFSGSETTYVSFRFVAPKKRGLKAFISPSAFIVPQERS